MHSLIGLSIFLFGSTLLILLMLALSSGGGYNGLNPIGGVYISMIVIGAGFFVMFYVMLRAIEKGTVNVPRAVVPIAIIGLGCLAFIWYFSNWYLFPMSYTGCPTDGVCWAELQMPVALMILADVGAILLQTPFVTKKRVHAKALATLLPQTQ
jgi:hypothetical protein